MKLHKFQEKKDKKHNLKYKTKHEKRWWVIIDEPWQANIKSKSIEESLISFAAKASFTKTWSATILAELSWASFLAILCISKYSQTDENQHFNDDTMAAHSLEWGGLGFTSLLSEVFFFLFKVNICCGLYYLLLTKWIYNYSHIFWVYWLLANMQKQTSRMIEMLGLSFCKNSRF